MVSEQDNLTCIQNEHLHLVLRLSQEQGRRFQRTFGLLCFLAFAFFFAILLPYFSIKTRRAGIEKHLQKAADGIARMKRRLQVYESALTGYRKVRREIEGGPEHLWEFIATPAQEAAPTETSPPQQPEQGVVERSPERSG